MSEKDTAGDNIETLSVHAGLSPDESTGAIAPAIHLATTFERDVDGSYSRDFRYAREGNPNRASLERCLCLLEGGAAAAAFASGSAATLAVFQSVGPGRHIVASADAYYGTSRQLTEIISRCGIQVSLVDMTDLQRVEEQLRPETRLLWAETPSNPLLKISDLPALKRLASKNDALLACDNTFATPVLQSPLSLGADLVVHSATKYLGGHGDLTGGIVVSKTEHDFFAEIRHHQISGGSVPSPFDCWLLRRSITTLPYRVRAQSASALRIAEELCVTQGVTRVYYPGLTGHPGHRIAAAQMSAFGGVLAFCIDGDKDVAVDVAARTRLITRATSLGGVETLIEHRASMEGPSTRCPDNLLRLSLGLEHADDLIADLRQAIVGAV